MKQELIGMQIAMEDVYKSLSRLIAQVDFAYQKQAADVAMQANKTLAGIKGLLRSIKKEGE